MMMIRTSNPLNENKQQNCEAIFVLLFKFLGYCSDTMSWKMQFITLRLSTSPLFFLPRLDLPLFFSIFLSLSTFSSAVSFFHRAGELRNFWLKAQFFWKRVWCANLESAIIDFATSPVFFLENWQICVNYEEAASTKGFYAWRAKFKAVPIIFFSIICSE